MSAVLRVSPEEAHRLVTTEGYALVDVRTEAEFAEGRPRGAVNVPFVAESGGAPLQNTHFVEAMRARFSPDAKLVLSCRSGQRSFRAAEALAAAGFTSVIDQRAGWAGVRSPFGQLKEKGWEASGLPVEEG